MDPEQEQLDDGLTEPLKDYLFEISKD